MLTDEALKLLKPKEKNYKVADGDGMYVLVRPSGTLTFQLDYRIDGRRETVTLGKYGPAGLSLARAREKCAEARRAIAAGRSPAMEKQTEKRRRSEAAAAGRGRSPDAPKPAAALPRERIGPSLIAPSRENGKRARTRALLLDATARLIAACEADDISIGDIAIAAGVANGTFYNYFKTKAEIIAETAFRITEEIGVVIHDPDLAQSNPVAMVALGARRVMEFAIDHPTWAWALVRSAAYLPSARSQVYLSIGETVRLGIKCGVFKVKYDDFTLHLLMSMMFAAIQERLIGKVGPDVGARLAEMHLRVLGVLPEAAAEAAGYAKRAARRSNAAAASPGRKGPSVGRAKRHA